MCGLVAKMPIAMLVQDMAVVMEIIPTLTGSGKEAMQNCNRDILFKMELANIRANEV